MKKGCRFKESFKDINNYSKGQAKILTTVLIILVVIVAVAVVYNVVNPLISKQSGKILSQSQQIELSNALNVDGFTEVPEDDTVLVEVSRDTSIGCFSQIQFTIQTSETTCYVEQDAILGILESAVYTINVSDCPGDILSISAAPVTINQEECLEAIEEEEDSEPLIESLVAYYPFDTDVRDSIGDNHGSSQNGARIVTDSQRGNVLSLGNPECLGDDGPLGSDDYDCRDNYIAEDYIIIWSKLDTEMMNDFTISAWVKLSEGALGTENTIFWKNDDMPGLKVASTGQVSFTQYHQTIPGEVHSFRSTKVLEEDKWYHVTYTYDGSEFKGYVDANLEGSMAKSSESFPGEIVYIGRDDAPVSSERHFKGLIDNVKIWDIALSEEEVWEEFGFVEELTCGECSNIFGVGCNYESCMGLGDCYYNPTWIPFVSDCVDIEIACSQITSCEDYSDFNGCNVNSCDLDCVWSETGGSCLDLEGVFIEREISGNDVNLEITEGNIFELDSLLIAERIPSGMSIVQDSWSIEPDYVFEDKLVWLLTNSDGNFAVGFKDIPESISYQILGSSSDDFIGKWVLEKKEIEGVIQGDN